MGLLVDILSFVALTAGGAFYVIGAIGLNRMPDVFTRMHAVSVSETVGIGLLVLGMLLQAGVSLVAVKLIFIVLALWTSGAVATHALARAALHDGERPLLANAQGRLLPTDPVSLFPELAERLAAPLTSETPEGALEEAATGVPMGPDGPDGAVAADEPAPPAPDPHRRGGG
ncbi:MAG TPA: monovalent cation/H(+) antiporter subunit G [Thermohalobaculum sp.]|nr:monovalent cation/H(+) antiporter subunit G [Thermohalobaculum sp.]